MEEKIEGQVHTALVYVFYEFHNLKSLDHQTTQLEIKIKKKKENQAIAFCKYSCLANANKKSDRFCHWYFFLPEKEKLF